MAMCSAFWPSRLMKRSGCLRETPVAVPGITSSSVPCPRRPSACRADGARPIAPRALTLAVSRPPSRGGHSRPTLEGAAEGACVGVVEGGRDLDHRHARVLEELACDLEAPLFD